MKLNMEYSKQLFASPVVQGDKSGVDAFLKSADMSELYINVGMCYQLIKMITKEIDSRREEPKNPTPTFSYNIPQAPQPEPKKMPTYTREEPPRKKVNTSLPTENTFPIFTFGRHEYNTNNPSYRTDAENNHLYGGGITGTNPYTHARETIPPINGNSSQFGYTSTCPDCDYEVKSRYQRHAKGKQRVRKEVKQETKPHNDQTNTSATKFDFTLDDADKERIDNLIRQFNLLL